MRYSSLRIRAILPDEYPILRESLYHAIYLPEGTKPPLRSVVDLPELQVYIADFGTQPGDSCVVAEIADKVVGAAWSRIMQDFENRERKEKRWQLPA